MLIVTRRRYKRKHVVGGAGIFGTVANFVKRMATSNAAKALVSKLTSAAQTEFGKKALEAGKTGAKEIGLKLLDAGITKTKSLIDRAVLPTKNQKSVGLPAPSALASPAPSALPQRSKDILTSLINLGAQTNISNIINGEGVKNHNAVAIQDYVKRSGAGLWLA